MRIQLFAAAALAALLLPLGCATGTSITETDISAAREAGTLEDLFARVEAELVAEGPEPNEKTVATRARIGAILADETAKEIEAELESARREDGLIPLAQVDDAQVRIPEVERFDPTRAEPLTTLVQRESQNTNGAIRNLQAEHDAYAPDEYAGRLAKINAQLELVAPNSDASAMLEASRIQLVTGISESANAAIASENYEEAERMLRIAAEVDPENAEVGDQLATVDSKIFEQGFYKKLEDGDPDAAYHMLKEVSKAENFDAIRLRLEDSADPMADFFVALAGESTAGGSLPDAYRWFHQAREIRTLLGQTKVELRPEEASFVEVVKKRYWEARKQERPGLAWAYLAVVSEFEPTSPSLRRMERETREQVEQIAVKRLAALPFQHKTGGPEFGEAVSSKVIQHLFETIPQDIRIIEREQLGDIQRERELREGSAKLKSADYIVQGDILEAKVDSNEKEGRKTMRVVTERVTQPNPRYDTWLKLPSGEREDIPQPPAQIEVEKREDISVGETVHRKVGVFSVSYRVIDAATAKVIFADSLHEKEEHEDTSTEGVELGNFKIEFKLASLPSDLEILAGLADKVSAEIGKRLTGELSNPESRYDATGQRFVGEGNFARASEQFAFAHVLSERKGKDVGELTSRLRESAVASIERVTAS